MDEKMMLIGDWLDREHTVKALAEHYQVSRKTVYKWIKRYKTGGAPALEDASCAPRRHPNETSREIASKLIGAKLKHKDWGPKKVLRALERERPDTPWPAASTVQNIFRKEGLVRSRHLKRRTPPFGQPFRECLTPNDSWSIDYKGQFRTGDGKLCYPLTVSDNFSRFLLTCRGLLHPSLDSTRPWLERTFREYGLPRSLKSDNGSPFASVGLGGLSQLSAWLVKLNVIPERIAPSHPEQNGRHERMHRTLKEACCKPPCQSLRSQQLAFDRFRPEYNEERPHEALGMETPASLYEASRRLFPSKIPGVEYDSWVSVRRVMDSGCIKWKGEFVYISQALAGEPVGLTQIGEALWNLRFSFLLLGTFDEKTRKVLPMSPVQSVTYVRS
jgi:transposase InsO family protein